MLVSSTDVAYFAAAFIALIFVPGFIIASVVRPCSTLVERSALSIPVAYGFVTLVGLVCAVFHQHFDRTTYIVVALLTLVPLLYKHSRQRGRLQEHSQLFERWEIVPIGVGMTFVAVLLATNLQEVVPTGWDVSQHVGWINLIIKARVFPLRLLGPTIDSSGGAFYPPTFHVVSALLSEVISVPTYRIAFYSIVSVIAALPFGLFSYVKGLTSSPRLGALASLSSLAFLGLPFTALIGGLYPLTVSLLIAPMLALTLFNAVTKGERGAVILSALLGVGLFYTHPTEFLTTALLDVALFLSCPVRPLLVKRGAAYLALIMVVWGVAAWPALVGVARTITGGASTEINAKSLFARPASVNASASALDYVRRAFLENSSYIRNCSGQARVGRRG